MSTILAIAKNPCSQIALDIGKHRTISTHISMFLKVSTRLGSQNNLLYNCCTPTPTFCLFMSTLRPGHSTCFSCSLSYSILQHITYTRHLFLLHILPQHLFQGDLLERKIACLRVIDLNLYLQLFCLPGL